MFDDLKRIGLESCVLIAFGALFGLTLHHSLVLDAFSGRLIAQPRTAMQEVLPTTLPMPVLLDEVPGLVAAGGLLVDARITELYDLGHIDGAVSLPMAEVDTRLAGFLDDVARDRLIIIYCSGYGCPDSFDLGLLLLEAGFSDVRVFEGGYPEWRDAGLPVTGAGQ